MRIQDHIPEDLLTNTNVKNFTEVISLSQEYKELEIYKGVLGQINHFLNNDTKWLSNFLDDLGHIEYLDTMPKRMLENLINNAFDIFRYKGTHLGVCLYLRSLFDYNTGVTVDNTVVTVDNDTITVDAVGFMCEIDLSNFWGGGIFLSPDNTKGLGFLPDGDMLTTADITPAIFPFLFDEDFTFYQREVTIRLFSDFSQMPRFESFLLEVIPRYLAMTSPETAIINFGFYNRSGNPYTVDLTY